MGIGFLFIWFELRTDTCLLAEKFIFTKLYKAKRIQNEEH